MSVLSRLKAGETTLGVVGLGYVGMPLALAFGDKVKVVGYDTNAAKIQSYIEGIDPTMEVGNEALKRSSVHFTSDEHQLKTASFIIVAVPTPINADNMPDLSCVISACEIVGRNLTPGAVISFESTVYAGVTEEICLPILEKVSGLVCGKDFYIGYSPERINPGDKEHRLENIVKIVAGMDEKTTEHLAEVYGLVANSVFKAANIRVAELAKLAENVQRDVNIAFMNELSMIFSRLGVASVDVIRAMSTKWNALSFKPGLVGGHCISVDPYYLLYQTEKIGYHSLIIQSGRKINNSMGSYVANETVRNMILANQMIKNARVYIMGITYKENCPDIRNSMVLKILQRLGEYGIQPMVVDPLADKHLVKEATGIELVDMKDIHDADCLLFAVSHDSFCRLTSEQLKKMFIAAPEKNKVIIDIRNIFEQADLEEQGYLYWNL